MISRSFGFGKFYTRKTSDSIVTKRHKYWHHKDISLCKVFIFCSDGFGGWEKGKNREEAHAPLYKARIRSLPSFASKLAKTKGLFGIPISSVQTFFNTKLPNYPC